MISKFRCFWVAVFLTVTFNSVYGGFVFTKVAGGESECNSKATNKSLNIVFSHASGFYHSNFDLKISTPITGGTIIYTLDGSDPENSTTSILVSSEAVIHINPLNSENRSLTPGVIVRAIVVHNNIVVSKPTARTFIFIHQLKQQAYPGGSWPSNNPNNQIMDYEMDSNVIYDSNYENLIEDALLEIPTLSIIGSNESLFSADSGIYVNAMEQGEEWERECSVELLNHKGKEGFSINAGLRIRGGYSRHEFYARHGFRLFFREIYGESKLNFPLFDEEGVSEFDKIDLRCPQSFSWSRAYADDARKYNTYIRDVFSRDLQRDANQPYTRSRYYHLFLNGMYWGIYQTQERSEARYAESYFGGDNDDYDVIKTMGVGQKFLQATDGTMAKWEQVYELTQKGFASNKDYFYLEGKDANGKAIRNSEVFVDIDNLIDYTLNIFYTGNYDAAPSKWANNKQPNNMYAITNREDKSSGFRFFVHDSEFSLMNDPIGPGIGLYENRVNIGDLDDNRQMYVANIYVFSIQWLHYKLTKNSEYRVRFANRAYQQLTGNGILTPEKNIERFNKRVQQIDTAIIAESARWGDGTEQGLKALTKDNAWLPELNNIRNDFFPYRSNILINQLLDEGLFPSIDAPVFTNKKEIIEKRFVKLDTIVNVSIENLSANGIIYYTTDGSDPRKIGGQISINSSEYLQGSSIVVKESTKLKARVLDGNEWSALSELTFVAPQSNFSNFKVTELHYHPLSKINGDDTVSGKSYEFIEFKNISEKSSINLSGLIIDSAIYYEFPENFILAPQQYYVVASKPAKFYDRYGIKASGNFKKNLSNNSEQIIVFDSEGNVVMDITYKDDDDWPKSADGDGPSLCSVDNNPIGDPNSSLYWTSSKIIHGTPFSNDDTFVKVPEQVVVLSDVLVNVYPNPTNDILKVSVDNVTNQNHAIQLFDLDGRLLFQSTINSESTISLASLNIKSGIYMLSISTGSNKVHKKIIFTP